MGKSLIIAEKNSLAKNIATAIGVPYRNGRYENDKYVILACAGHLYGNYDAVDYPQYKEIKNWAEYKLPIVPKPFKMKKAKGKDNLIKNLV